MVVSCRSNECTRYRGVQVVRSVECVVARNSAGDAVTHRPSRQMGSSAESDSTRVGIEHLANASEVAGVSEQVVRVQTRRGL